METNKEYKKTQSFRLLRIWNGRNKINYKITENVYQSHVLGVDFKVWFKIVHIQESNKLINVKVDLLAFYGVRFEKNIF